MSPEAVPSRVLFDALVDDAAMFPPGNAIAAEAIRLHLEYRAAWFRDLIGPLLVPAAAWDPFVAAHAAAGSPQVAVVLIGTTDERGYLAEGIDIVGVEAPVAAPPLPGSGAVSLAAEVTGGAEAGPVLAAVAEKAARGRPVVAKFRTGGASAGAFPSERALAEVLDRAYQVGAPIKLTAGLHHAVRFTDDSTGFEHQGFVNVLVATRRWLAGEAAESLADALAERDAERLVAELAAVGTDEAALIRARFVSFGCCGVTDPIDDLVELGLVRRP